MYFLIDLEAVNPRSGTHTVRLQGELSSCLAEGCLLIVCSQGISLVPISPPILLDLSLTLYDLISLHGIPQSSISK